MPKFRCSYAVDIPHYFDFTIEAANEDAATKLINDALGADTFDEVNLRACHENEHDPRVFICSPVMPGDVPDDQILVHDKGQFSLVPAE